MALRGNGNVDMSIYDITHGFALGFNTTLLFFVGVFLYVWCYYRKHVDYFAEPYVEIWNNHVGGSDHVSYLIYEENNKTLK